MLIIPSILTNDASELKVLLEKAEKSVTRVQIDVIDAKFANNITIDPLILKQANTFLNLDFHLMVEEPIKWIDHCILRSKTRIIGQIEEMKSQSEFINEVINKGSIPGLAIDLPTDIDELDQQILSKVGVILLMSVKAGWGGQEFDLDVWEKIDKLVKLRSLLNLEFKICVDGGVTKELVHDMERGGVDEVVVGKRIFDQDLAQNLKLFTNG